MYKRPMMLALALLLLMGAAPLMTACHTTAGAGDDISRTGQAIQRSAIRNAP